MNESLLTFENVKKTYRSGERNLIILEDLTFSLQKGESVAVTGKSGSGKTTLLNLAGGLDRPDSGLISFRGERLSRMNDRKLSLYRNRHIGFIFQSHILLEDFTALENVMMPSLIQGSSRKEVRVRATHLLERVGLLDRKEHYPRKLSGGERQRVALCRALINDPSIIIADEPTGSLDEQSSAEVEALLFSLVQEEGRTLLMVTHDPSLARRCSSVYLLSHRNMESI